MPGATSREDLLNSLHDLAKELGRSPSQKDINEHTSHSHKTYYRKFDGGLKEAKERLDFEHYEKQGRDRVEVECANCGETVQKTPSEVDTAQYHYCSQQCHHDHRGERYRDEKHPTSTMKTVECSGCGRKIQRAKWERDRVNRHFCSYGCMAESAQVECEECGSEFEVIPSTAPERRFCSRDCVHSWMSGGTHPRWRGGYEPYYGSNWPRQRRRALKRDQYRCQDCGMTAAESISKNGESLSVHHKTRVNDFVENGELDEEEANRLENLVTLCRPCHMLREGSANRLQK